MTACIQENVDAVRDFLQLDRRVSVEHVTESVGVSHGTAHHILTHQLGKRKVAAKWVPHELSEEQKQRRLQISHLHLLRAHREENDFLSRIVACDETWCYSYDPE